MRCFLWAVVGLCPLFVPHCFADEDGTRLAPVFAQKVDRRLDVPVSEQSTYADLLTRNLNAASMTNPQYVVIVDRNIWVQALLIYWMSADRVFHFIGASPVSTGNPGRFEHFVTPTGVFEHTLDNRDFRAKGTTNELGFRGFGAKGMRVYDFGWQDAIRGWDHYSPGKVRLEMHATDPDRLARKLGTPQSEGCIRIPAALNVFIDHYGILDGAYDKAMAAGAAFWVLPKTREATPWSGTFLVVADTGRTERPAWSPAPLP